MGCAFPFLVACRQEGVKQRRSKDSFPCRRIEIAQLQIRWFAIIEEIVRAVATAEPVMDSPVQSIPAAVSEEELHAAYDAFENIHRRASERMARINRLLSAKAPA